MTSAMTGALLRRQLRRGSQPDSSIKVPSRQACCGQVHILDFDMAAVVFGMGSDEKHFFSTGQNILACHDGLCSSRDEELCISCIPNELHLKPCV